MKLALMQPYLFPYLGYFQLISACDVFVIHDDVQYIKAGWINRNRILANGREQLVTIPVQHDQFTKRINERRFVACPAPGFSALRQIDAAYRRAPYHAATIALVERSFACEDMNVARFVTHAITQVCRHLHIDTPIEVSSTISTPDHLHGEDRVLMMNKRFNADHYINPVGGVDLYNRNRFRDEGIELSFLRTRPITYRQFDQPFVPFLSIVDVLMFNSIDATRRLLSEYDLV